MAQKDPAQAPPKDAPLSSLVPAGVSGLAALQALIDAPAPHGPMAELLAHRLNTGVAGGAAIKAVGALDAPGAAALVEGALAAKVGEGGAAEWLRGKLAEAVKA